MSIWQNIVKISNSLLKIYYMSYLSSIGTFTPRRRLLKILVRKSAITKVSQNSMKNSKGETTGGTIRAGKKGSRKKTDRHSEKFWGRIRGKEDGDPNTSSSGAQSTEHLPLVMPHANSRGSRGADIYPSLTRLHALFLSFSFYTCISIESARPCAYAYDTLAGSLFRFWVSCFLIF